MILCLNNLHILYDKTEHLIYNFLVYNLHLMGVKYNYKV